jgi:inosine triphosphate pyrophosphatase
MLESFPDKSARAECRIALLVPGKSPLIFTGTCDGQIVPPRGKTDFGWDPIFQPLNFDQTFAEMPMDTKNSISHRGNAMKLALEFFQNTPNWLD